MINTDKILHWYKYKALAIDFVLLNYQTFMLNYHRRDQYTINI